MRLFRRRTRLPRAIITIQILDPDTIVAGTGRWGTLMQVTTDDLERMAFYGGGWSEMMTGTLRFSVEPLREL